METILGTIAVLFTMMFFILGVLVKLVLSFRAEMRETFKGSSKLFWEHEHNGEGRVFIPRNQTATNP